MSSTTTPKRAGLDAFYTPDDVAGACVATIADDVRGRREVRPARATGRGGDGRTRATCCGGVSPMPSDLPPAAAAASSAPVEPPALRDTPAETEADADLFPVGTVLRLRITGEEYFVVGYAPLTAGYRVWHIKERRAAFESRGGAHDAATWTVVHRPTTGVPTPGAGAPREPFPVGTVLRYNHGRRSVSCVTGHTASSHHGRGYTTSLPDGGRWLDGWEWYDIAHDPGRYTVLYQPDALPDDRPLLAAARAVGMVDAGDQVEFAARVVRMAGELRRYREHLNDIRCDILDRGHPLGDDSDPELTPRRLVRELLDRVPDPKVVASPGGGWFGVSDPDAPATTRGEAAPGMVSRRAAPVVGGVCASYYVDDQVNLYCERGGEGPHEYHAGGGRVWTDVNFNVRNDERVR